MAKYKDVVAQQSNRLQAANQQNNNNNNKSTHDHNQPPYKINSSSNSSSNNNNQQTTGSTTSGGLKIKEFKFFKEKAKEKDKLKNSIQKSQSTNHNQSIDNHLKSLTSSNKSSSKHYDVKQLKNSSKTSCSKLKNCETKHKSVPPLSVPSSHHHSSHSTKGNSSPSKGNSPSKSVSTTTKLVTSKSPSPSPALKSVSSSPNKCISSPNKCNSSSPNKCNSSSPSKSVPVKESSKSVCSPSKINSPSKGKDNSSTKQITSSNNKQIKNVLSTKNSASDKHHDKNDKEKTGKLSKSKSSSINKVNKNSVNKKGDKTKDGNKKKNKIKSSLESLKLNNNNKLNNINNNNNNKSSLLYDEDIIEGFAILSFLTLKDLEVATGTDHDLDQEAMNSPSDKISLGETSPSCSCSTPLKQSKSSCKSNDNKEHKEHNKEHKSSSGCSSKQKDSKESKISDKNSSVNSGNNNHCKNASVTTTTTTTTTTTVTNTSSCTTTASNGGTKKTKKSKKLRNDSDISDSKDNCNTKDNTSANNRTTTNTKVKHTKEKESNEKSNKNNKIKKKSSSNNKINKSSSLSSSTSSSSSLSSSKKTSSSSLTSISSSSECANNKCDSDEDDNHNSNNNNNNNKDNKKQRKAKISKSDKNKNNNNSNCDQIEDSEKIDDKKIISLNSLNQLNALQLQQTQTTQKPKSSVSSALINNNNNKSTSTSTSTTNCSKTIPIGCIDDKNCSLKSNSQNCSNSTNSTSIQPQQKSNKHLKNCSPATSPKPLINKFKCDGKEQCNEIKDCINKCEIVNCVIGKSSEQSSSTLKPLLETETQNKKNCSPSTSPVNNLIVKCEEQSNELKGNCINNKCEIVNCVSKKSSSERLQSSTELLLQSSSSSSSSSKSLSNHLLPENCIDNLKNSPVTSPKPIINNLIVNKCEEQRNEIKNCINSKCEIVNCVPASSERLQSSERTHQSSNSNSSLKRPGSPISLSNNQCLNSNKISRKSSVTSPLPVPVSVHQSQSHQSQRSSTPNIKGSNSSLSSLSQLSQSIGNNTNCKVVESKEKESKRTSGSSTLSKNNTPSTQSGITNTSSSSTTENANNYSISKNRLWSSNSNSLVSGGSKSVSVSHLSSSGLPPPPTRTATPSPSLASLNSISVSTHHQHHLHHQHQHQHQHQQSNHLNMFASPIPPGSLSSVGGAAAPSATPSPFIGDSLYSHQNQDFLRRELDTRFLASQDRTINIPPPPYMRAEMSQHVNVHLPHNQSPYALPNSLGGSLVPPTNPHLFEKYAKLDPAFYGRTPLGLPGFPSLSPLLTQVPGGSTAGALAPVPAPPQGALIASASTPFAPPGHLAAFQPKLNTLTNKNKPTSKSGRWCAMHVRIAWEIYHSQQKQTGDGSSGSSSHKGSSSSQINLNGSSSSKNNSGSDMLKPLNQLFPLPPRPHETMSSFSSALLSAAGVHSARTPFDTQPPIPTAAPGQFGSAAAHLGHFARPSFAGYGGFPSLGLGLSGATPGSSNPSLFGPTPASAVSRDPLSLTACLPGLSAAVPDPWARNAPPSHRATPALFPPLTPTSSSSSTSSSWGGLKAEAERNDRHSADAYNKRKSNDLDVKRSDHNNSKHNSEGKSNNKSDEKSSSERHKEHHTSHKHTSSSSSSHVNSHLRNGDVHSESKNKDTNNKISNKREASRSPVNHQPSKLSKYDNNSAFDNKINSLGERVKEEQKEENGLINPRNERHDKPSGDNANESLNKSSNPLSSSSANLYHSPSTASTLAAMSLNTPLERARLMGLFGLHGTGVPPSVPPPHPLATPNPNDQLRSFWGPLFSPSGQHPDPFKSLHEFQIRPDFLERDNVFQRYSLLNSSGGGASLMEKIAKENAEKELRELNNSFNEKHNSKLRISEPTNTFTGLPPPPPPPPPPPLPPSTTSVSASSSLFPANPYLNSLHSLSTTAGSGVRNNSKTSLNNSSPTTPSSHSPSLASTNGSTPTIPSSVTKMSVNSLVDNHVNESKKENSSSKKTELNSNSNGNNKLPNSCTTNSNTNTNNTLTTPEVGETR